MEKRKIASILLLLLLSIGYLIAPQAHADSSFAQAQPIGAQEAKEDSESVFTGLLPEAVQKIEINYEHSLFALERAPSAMEWTMVDPLGALTNNEKVSQMIQAITSLQVFNTLKAKDLEPDLSLYGFTPPALEVTFRWTQGEETMLFGKKHPITGRRYLKRKSGDEVLLVNDDAFITLACKKDEVRNRHPLRFSLDTVEEITLLRTAKLGRGGTLRLLRSGENPQKLGDDWILESATERLVADKSIIEKALQLFSGTTVERFIDQPTEGISADTFRDPALTVTLKIRPSSKVSGQDGLRTVSIVFQEVGDKSVRKFVFRALDQKWIYQAAGFPIADFLKPASYFRDRSPFDDYRVFDLTSVLVRRGDSEEETFALEAVKGKKGYFKLQADGIPEGSVELNQKALLAWLESLVKLEVLSYPTDGGVDHAEYGFDSPTMSILFSVSGEGKTEASYSLVIGRKVGEHLTTAPRKTPPRPDTGGKAKNEAMLPPGLVKTEAPRYAGIQLADSTVIPAFLSSVTWSRLNKRLKDLVNNGKKNPA